MDIPSAELLRVDKIKRMSAASRGVPAGRWPAAGFTRNAHTLQQLHLLGAAADRLPSVLRL